MSFLFTSESVCAGHPDKLCDIISDSILDAYLQSDSAAKVACETISKTGMVFVFGEISSHAHIEIEPIVRKVLENIGYTQSDFGIDANACAVIHSIGKQSADIAMGVERKDQNIGAGDQGIMFGYACDETKDNMPLSISLAHGLTKQLETARKKNILPWLRPDGKSQVTIEYNDDGTPKRIHTIVLSAQHNPEISLSELQKELTSNVILPIAENWIDEDTVFHINPTGRFVTGGPQGDSGLTGRKIIVDTYGGHAPHGGGAFSGKDPSKPDRSAAYMARFIAKNIVTNGLAKKCLVQLSYAIGIPHAISIWIETYGTETIPKKEIYTLVEKNFDTSISGIITTLNLLHVPYAGLASYGHFGENAKNMPWEQKISLT